MSRFRLTAKAKADLRSVWSYIAADNVDAAERVEGAIYDIRVLFRRRLLHEAISARI